MYNGIIYKATCLINNKVYIGQTIHGLKMRKYTHESNSLNKKLNYYFYRALRKHGINNFKWGVIDRANSEEELNILEKLYIEEHRRKGHVYNMTDGGEGMSGYILSEETKKKMSESSKGHVPWNKGRPGLKGKKAPFYGKKHTEESKMKMSESNKGEKSYLYGKHLTEKTLMKMSIANKGENNSMYGKHHTEETKRKLSEAKKGCKHTEKAKIKIGKASKGRFCSEETRKKMSKVKKGKLFTLEHKRKISESKKGQIPWNKGKHHEAAA